MKDFQFVLQNDLNLTAISHNFIATIYHKLE